MLHLFCFRRESKAVIGPGRNTGSRLRSRPMQAGHRASPPSGSDLRRKGAATELRLADARRILQHGLEHRFQFPRRAGDDLQHLGGRGLLLQQITQLVEQPRVLNGDDGLRGEVGDQLDLLVGKRANLLSENDECTDELVVFEHRHAQSAALASLNGRDKYRIALEVSAVARGIRYVDDLFGREDAAKDGVRTWVDRRLLDELDEFTRDAISVSMRKPWPS